MTLCGLAATLTLTFDLFVANPKNPKKFMFVPDCIEVVIWLNSRNRFIRYRVNERSIHDHARTDARTSCKQNASGSVLTEA